MSVFGDGRYHMNNLYDELENFIKEGGTLSELFEVMEWFFKDMELKSN